MSQAKPIFPELKPILENGDRLSRPEFEFRYNQLPHVKKAELVEGVVFMVSPVRARQHGRPHSLIMGWLMVYEASNPNVMVLDNTTVRLDWKNEVQPDALLRLEESVGGQSRITEDDYVEGPPELIVEIAASSAAYDLHDKLQVYLRNGVKEYLVWVVQEKEFRWYIFDQGEYIQQQPDERGYLKSQNFSGLWLDVKALLDGQIQKVLLVLQQGIESINN
ncbi:Uma2 family endonuclease [Okeania sp.]|uniref:Uma2 family endonuclease n=1 Tax=Okeania sp. TaxID=3100323 RepID=UPI002B4B8D14|nr:Uma2 family endonuclease [Okeania sp.]MEB3341275.1 Uma2 family endonuclease [Okeania sp.]